MSHYFPPEESIYSRQGSDPFKAMATVANRYVGSAPPSGFAFRTISGDSFRQQEDGRYELDMNAKWPGSRLGDYGYAHAIVHSEHGETIELSLSCRGPVRLYLNGSLLYKSTMDDDVNAANKRLLKAELRKGSNALFVKMLKTASGFGCLLGSSNYKWFPLHVLAPYAERAGSGGWAYSYSRTDLYPAHALPDAFGSESELPTQWLPALSATAGDGCDFEELYGRQPGHSAYGWSQFATGGIGEGRWRLEGDAAGPATLWVDGKPVLTVQGGPFAASLLLKPGMHSLVALAVCGEQGWRITVAIAHEGSRAALSAPPEVKGVCGAWLCLGPFGQGEALPVGADGEGRLAPGSLETLRRLFPSGQEGSAGLYWRVSGLTDGYVRPYLENERFARWNYPLGVTLYGLLQTGRLLGRDDLIAYVSAHIRECTALYEYSLWDRERYGAPAINHQLAELNMLDDCGSFGSAMLEAYPDMSDERSLAIAHMIADYMLRRQERRADGAFFRLRQGEYQENTLWADDLYMSTPFLVRYYKHTGDRQAIDEAARQFLLFKSYLFMPEQAVMSHVYDFKYNTPTYVPWGRGNGWVLFSLSELLAVLPDTHPDRGALLAMFNELAEGYLRLQGERGLWHQVLTDPTSYEEASCTAMFAYGFAKGVRCGWLRHPAPYADAVRRAWEGLTRFAIDCKGNVYGVCRGSGYSFTPDYYRDELGWILNDTHGIGIVLLCAAECARMDAPASQ